MTSIIYQRGQRRESTIWDAFLWNGPFNAGHDSERATLFGIYAYSYLQGHAYLQEIETEDLARLVDTYNSNIASITNDEAKLVLEVAAKRYLENIESLLHIQKKDARERDIDALNQEYDAKIEALEADQLAITTKTAEVLYARDKTVLKITELEIAADLEGVKQELIDAEITEKEIEAARIDLRILEVGLEGLNIQLAITQVALDMTNTDLQITNAENEKAEFDIKISEVDIRITEEGIRRDNVTLAETRSVAEKQRLLLRIARVSLDIDKTEIDIIKAENEEAEIDIRIADIQIQTDEEAIRGDKIGHDESRSVTEEMRLKLKTAETTTKIAEVGQELDKIDIEEGELDIRISEVGIQITEEGIRADRVGLDEIKSAGEEKRLITKAGGVAVQIEESDLKVVETGLKETETVVQTKNIEADIAKLGLVDTELVLTQAEKTMQEVDNKILLDKRDLLSSKGDHVTDEKIYYQDYKTTQEKLDEKLDEHETNMGEAKRDRLERAVSQKEEFGQDERQQVHPSKRDLADEKYDAAIINRDLRKRMIELRAEAAELYRDASILAAQDLADANIVNTLTHTIGSA